MTKEFSREEGQEKLKELVESIGTCMFITNTSAGADVRPMATTKVDEAGALWFFTNINTPKVAELNNDHHVHLLYSHPGKDSYLDVRGTATVETSREKIKELWNPMVKAWFPDGVNDPEICLLKVEVDSAYYWDSGSSKMVSFFKIIASAVSGKQLLEGEEGTLLH